ncbi:MAG: sel1 repeat family protein [Acidobacteriia bacterium]|nr:sel1 repeat family protein [Terriglobia bacterium]
MNPTGKFRSRMGFVAFVLSVFLTACESTQGGPDAKLLAKAKAGDASAQLAMAEKQTDASVAAGWYRQAAKQGNARAQAALGLMYLQGKGVSKDETQGNLWIQKSADGGFPLAQRLMCSRSLSQDDYARNARTLEWCEKAAAQNDPVAESILGQMYLMGKGVKKDLPQAADWFRKSAEQGNGVAQMSLGRMCLLGMGTKQDAAESYFWLKLASLGQNELEAPEQVQKELALQAKALPFGQKDAVEKRVQEWLKTHPTASLANN